MSLQDNVALVRRHYEAFRSGDMGAFMETYAVEAEVREPESLPWGGTYRGHEGIAELAAGFQDAWDDVDVEPQEFLALGERVVALDVVRGRTAAGAEVEMPGVESFRVLDGRIAEQRVFYWDTAELARALDGS